MLSTLKAYWPIVPSTLTAIKIALELAHRRDQKMENRLIDRLSTVKEELALVRAHSEKCERERADLERLVKGLTHG